MSLSGAIQHQVSDYDKTYEMAINITIHVKDGIVMASDSRLVKQITSSNLASESKNQSLVFLDSAVNLLLIHDRIGIGKCGEPIVRGILVEDHLKQILTEKFETNADETGFVAESILRFFRKFQPYPEITFHIAGYSRNSTQQIWRVDIPSNSISQSNAADRPGLIFDGEADAVLRLTYPLGRLDEQKRFQAIPHFGFAWPNYTVQDAINLATFLVQTQTNLVQFQSRLKSIGGPIDVLVIQPDKAFWAQKKAI